MCAGLVAQLRDGLEPAVDAAALQQAGAALESKVLEVRPPSRSSGAEPPANAHVVCVSSLASYAARGLGACGDVCCVWTAAYSRARPLPSQPQALLPVQPWLVAGVLRCNADGLRLESGDGMSIHVEARDALAAMPLVDRPVLAQRWALPPSSALPPVLEVRSFAPLDGLSAACARTLFLGDGCAAGAVVAVSPLLRIQRQTFCIVVRAPVSGLGQHYVFHCHHNAAIPLQELRDCRTGRALHVFLDNDALRWRTPLLSAAGRGSCIVLSALTPRTLFPEQPDRRWPVLVASASTALSSHGCSLTPAASAGVLCTCDTCLREDTLSVHAEVMEQELSDVGLAFRVRICAGSCCHAGKEVPLLLAHYLSGMMCSCAVSCCAKLNACARRRTKPVAAAGGAARCGGRDPPRASSSARGCAACAGRLLAHDAARQVRCIHSSLPILTVLN